MCKNIPTLVEKHSLHSEHWCSLDPCTSSKKSSVETGTTTSHEAVTSLEMLYSGIPEKSCLRNIGSHLQTKPGQEGKNLAKSSASCLTAGRAGHASIDWYHFSLRILVTDSRVGNLRTACRGKRPGPSKVPVRHLASFGPIHLRRLSSLLGSSSHPTFFEFLSEFLVICRVSHFHGTWCVLNQYVHQVVVSWLAAVHVLLEWYVVHSQKISHPKSPCLVPLVIFLTPPTGVLRIVLAC